MFISSRILSPCSTSLLEYHVRKNLPASVRYVPPSAVKKNVSSGVSLYSPAAASGSSHFGCPASVAATLKFSSRYLSDVREFPTLALRRPVIHADGEVLLVPRTARARVVHVGVVVADVADSTRQRDGSLYTRHSYRAGPAPLTMPHYTSAMTPSTPASRRSRVL
ncbi:hypothetical protein OsI_03785 [Oryza sativa Indica Group]|uniref:Uncharacterized protein n=1 Tax=Oryza sativa subsp. indica TaxID=39946 RepID=B8A9R6_ORYSI|nr:hypothetical protein OsI_03785 [Oryza sativa Indica Group]